MKKIIIMLMACLGLMAVGVLFMQTASNGQTFSNEEEQELDLGEKFKYRQFTPDDKIIKGNQTALETMEKYFDTKLSVGEDYSLDIWMQSDPVQNCNKKYEYLIYQVDKFDKSRYAIVFLFHDDTKIVEATPQDRTFISEDEIVDPDYMTVVNEKNYQSGAFAWQTDESAYAILDDRSGYRCSSIWAYDNKTNQVTLVFADWNNPIWMDYSMEYQSN